MRKQSQRCAFQSEGVFKVMQDNSGCVALVHIGLAYLVQYIYIICVQVPEEPYLQYTLFFICLLQGIYILVVFRMM